MYKKSKMNKVPYANFYLQHSPMFWNVNKLEASIAFMITQRGSIFYVIWQIFLRNPMNRLVATTEIPINFHAYLHFVYNSLIFRALIFHCTLRTSKTKHISWQTNISNVIFLQTFLGCSFDCLSSSPKYFNNRRYLKESQ